jgi:hypothetical protein
MNKRIKPSKLKNKSDIHPSKPSVDNETLRFSFKHLDLNHKKFSIKKKEHDYFGKVLERLKAISTFKASEVFANRSSSLRAHPIDWRHTSEKKGFSHLNSQLQDIPAYQFQISSNEHGRIHGFILENIFFIIWFDPEHNLYT